MPQSAGPGSNSADAQYIDLLKSVKKQFGAHAGPIFTTDANNLYDLYLAKLPEDERQAHSCSACKNFLRHYGHLVRVDGNGKTHSLMWSKDFSAPIYAVSVSAMKAAVESAGITGVFCTAKPSLGVSEPPEKNKSWTHFCVKAPEDVLSKSALQTPYQVMAEKLEDHKNMTKALEEFKSKHLNTAVKVLKSNNLFRTEKVLGAAEWLKKTHDTYTATKGAKARENILWLEVARAPVGFCHPRSSMIGTLLEDIEKGLDFDEVKAKFEAKMHPLQYQRPQALPSAANIARAEKIFKELGAESALKRRYATLEEIETLWKAKWVKQESVKPGIFSRLQPKPAGGKKSTEGLEIPPITMTWSKFKSTVLDDAELIEYFTPAQRMSYGTFVTATDESAPALLQWDSAEKRNAFSYYQYVNGSLPEAWGLKARHWFRVNAVSIMPAHWHSDKFNHHSKSLLFIIDKARDLHHKTAGLAIFPENLKAEFREVRQTIEAYSKSGTISGIDDSSASGVLFSDQGTNYEFLLKVTNADGCQTYLLDRWD